MHRFFCYWHLISLNLSTFLYLKTGKKKKKDKAASLNLVMKAAMMIVNWDGNNSKFSWRKLAGVCWSDDYSAKGEQSYLAFPANVCRDFRSVLLLFHPNSAGVFLGLYHIPYNLLCLFWIQSGNWIQLCYGRVQILFLIGFYLDWIGVNIISLSMAGTHHCLLTFLLHWPITKTSNWFSCFGYASNLESM